MNPIKGLLRSRKFLLLMLDTVVSLTAVVGGWFLAPQELDKILTVVGILQPVFIALIASIAAEDAAAMKAGLRR